jgi:hypothetical protein
MLPIYAFDIVVPCCGQRHTHATIVVGELGRHGLRSSIQRTLQVCIRMHDLSILQVIINKVSIESHVCVVDELHAHHFIGRQMSVWFLAYCVRMSNVLHFAALATTWICWLNNTLHSKTVNIMWINMWPSIGHHFVGGKNRATPMDNTLCKSMNSSNSS